MKKILVMLCAISLLLFIIYGCTALEVTNDIEEKSSVNQIITSEKGEDIKEDETVDKAIVYEQITQTVLALNENSNLYIDLLTLVNETEYASFFNIERIRQTPSDEPMPNEFDIRDEDDTKVGVGAVLPFPWDSDDLRLTKISWTESGLHHVFGIDVGDNLEKAENILRELGYVKRDLGDSATQTDWYVERFGRITVFELGYVSIVFTVFEFEGSSNIDNISLHVLDPFRQRHTEHGVEGVDLVS